MALPSLSRRHHLAKLCPDHYIEDLMVYTNDLCDVDILRGALVDGCMMPDAMYIMKISTQSIEDGNVYRILPL